MANEITQWGCSPKSVARYRTDSDLAVFEYFTTIKDNSSLFNVTFDWSVFQDRLPENIINVNSNVFESEDVNYKLFDILKNGHEDDFQFSNLFDQPIKRMLITSQPNEIVNSTVVQIKNFITRLGFEPTKDLIQRVLSTATLTTLTQINATISRNPDIVLNIFKQNPSLFRTGIVALKTCSNSIERIYGKRSAILKSMFKPIQRAIITGQAPLQVIAKSNLKGSDFFSHTTDAQLDGLIKRLNPNEINDFLKAFDPIWGKINKYLVTPENPTEEPNGSKDIATCYFGVTETESPLNEADFLAIAIQEAIAKSPNITFIPSENDFNFYIKDPSQDFGLNKNKEFRTFFNTLQRDDNAVWGREGIVGLFNILKGFTKANNNLLGLPDLSLFETFLDSLSGDSFREIIKFLDGDFGVGNTGPNLVRFNQANVGIIRNTNPLFILTALLIIESLCVGLNFTRIGFGILSQYVPLETFLIGLKARAARRLAFVREGNTSIDFTGLPVLDTDSGGGFTGLPFIPGLGISTDAGGINAFLESLGDNSNLFDFVNRGDQGGGDQGGGDQGGGDQDGEDQDDEDPNNEVVSGESKTGLILLSVAALGGIGYWWYSSQKR